MSTSDPLFRQPLHLFSIPSSVLSQLVPRASPLDNIQAPELGSIHKGSLESESTDTPSPAAPHALACQLCKGVTFANLDEQRSHFRSDWHRYNVKMRLNDSSAAAVNEPEFSNLIDALEESLSGSESSESEVDAEGAEIRDTVSTLVNKRQLSLAASSSLETFTGTIPKSPILWFQNPAIPNTQLGIYTLVFPSNLPSQSSPSHVEALRSMQNAGENGRLWTLMMTAGGHFAAMVVRVCLNQNEDGEKVKGNKANTRTEMEILKHKTFHRYTTRKKQGGSQSVNDNAKGAAISAGAMLRRYGEQALREDIRALLSEWKEEVDISERIFIRASVSNRRIFYDYDGAIISKSDQRLRTFPFPTRRPTQSELTRCLVELTRVKVTHLTQEDLRAQDEALLASLPKPRPTPQPRPAPPAATLPKPAKLSKDEQLNRERLRRFLDMIRKGRLDAARAFWQKEGAAVLMGETSEVPSVNSRLPQWLDDPGEDEGAQHTLLQVASSVGQADIVRWLLEDLHADPRVPLPTALKQKPLNNQTNARDFDSDTTAPDNKDRAAAGHLTAYDIASSKEARNVFRRCAWAHPDWWDWLGEGRVPSTLSPEMEEEQDRKKGDRKRGMKERAKEREAARVVEATPTLTPVAIAKPTSDGTKGPGKAGPRRLGGVGGEVDQAGVAGLTLEMRAKVERERRARAAEARLRGTGGS